MMQQAGMQIAELVEALLRKGAPRVALVGGLAEVLKEYLPSAIADQLVLPQADAMAGGILLAKKRSSEKMQPRHSPAESDDH